LELSLPCRPDVTVDEFDHRERLKVVFFVLFGSDITRIKGGGQMVPKFVGLASALAAELNIFLIRESSESFRQIRGD
jgi:hypothetical protein